MNKEYVKEYVALETAHWWFKVRQKIILQILQKFIPQEKTKRLKILNVGIAGGASSNWLSQLGDVVSVENEPAFLEYLHSQNFPVTNASITSLPFKDNIFDLVCAFDVIEHVEGHQLAIAELWRVCKLDGSLCITVPAFQSLWSNHDVVNGHQRRYTKNELQNLIGSNKIIYSTYFNTILFVPIFLFRKAMALFNNKPKKEESDFSYSKTNSLAGYVFGIEPLLLRFIKFPFGVSLIALAKKVSE
jgi:SAM-dependent methyltransferase